MDQNNDPEAQGNALKTEGGGPWGGRGGKGSGGGGSGGSGGGNGDDGGGGPRNPWQFPPDGGKPRKPRGPSALDELQRRLNDMMGGRGSGGGDGGVQGMSLAKFVIFGGIAIWCLLTSFHRIDPQERGVVTRFGAYSRTLSSGIGLTLPAPIERVKVLNVAEIRIVNIPGTGGQNFMLTGDQNIVDLDYAVRWNIKDPQLYLFQLADPDETVREVAETSMRAAISRATLTGAIGAQRAAIEADVEQRMRRILDDPKYRAGVRIESVAIKNADPPAEVNEAFKEVTAAQQEVQSLLNRANAYAQQVTQIALGEAARFDKVYEQYRLSPEVTRRRLYYETMEKVLAKTDKTIVEAPGVTPFLPLPEIRKRAQAAGGGQ
jgi:modulator of FtsH protease HflK